MNADKMRLAADNFLNGNRSSFRKQVENFKKYEIVDLILFIEEFYSYDINNQEFKKLLREYLKR